MVIFLVSDRRCNIQTFLSVSANSAPPVSANASSNISGDVKKLFMLLESAFPCKCLQAGRYIPVGFDDFAAFKLNGIPVTLVPSGFAKVRPVRAKLCPIPDGGTLGAGGLPSDGRMMRMMQS